MLGCEDALVHLLNFVWPNIFETSPHVINAVFEAIEVSECFPPALRFMSIIMIFFLSSGGVVKGDA